MCLIATDKAWLLEKKLELQTCSEQHEMWLQQKSQQQVLPLGKGSVTRKHKREKHSTAY